MTLLKTVYAFLLAHKIFSAWLLGSVASTLAWSMHTERGKAFIARHPAIAKIAPILSQRILAILAALGGDLPKLIFAAVAGQDPVTKPVEVPVGAALKAEVEAEKK